MNQKSIFKALYFSLIVIFLCLNIFTYLFISKSYLKELAFLTSITALLSSFFILINNKWTIVFDLIFLITYGIIAYKNRIYSEAFIKLFVLVPLTLYGLKSVFSKKTRREWVKIIYLERKSTNVSQNKFFILALVIVTLGFFTRNILIKMGDSYADVSVICITTSLIATLLHYSYDSSKWVYWIVYNTTTLYIWYTHNMNPNITLYSLYFLLISILGTIEYFLNRHKRLYNSIFSVDIFEMEKERRKTNGDPEKY